MMIDYREEQNKADETIKKLMAENPILKELTVVFKEEKSFEVRTQACITKTVRLPDGRVIYTCCS